MEKTCSTWSLDTCVSPAVGSCSTAYIKTALAPVRITASTAKLGFSVPRQSVLVSPLSSGWSMVVKRGGTNAVVATYTIAEYNSAKSQVVFFIDDTTRNAAKGYYYAEVSKDCCIVARVVLHIDCERAEQIEVFDFTHDPQPLACENEVLKPAVCAAPPCPAVKNLELAC